MRIRVLSDLHLEFFDWVPPPVEADVVVLAGDIQQPASADAGLARRCTSSPEPLVIDE
jgi:hypothetical protein